MIEYFRDLTEKLEFIARETNNGDRIKATRMLRDISMEYSVLNKYNLSDRSEFIKKYQNRFKQEFKR